MVKDVCYTPSLEQKVSCASHRETFGRFQRMLMARIASHRVMPREIIVRSIISGRPTERLRLAYDA
jgi:hypothetical protein